MLKIAIVCSQFNETITDALFEGTKKRLLELGLGSEQIHATFVPGAIEIPIMAQKLAQSQKFAAIIVLGAVIRGETSHYDYVCSQVSDGCLRVSLDEGIPVIFGVLTTENEAQALERVSNKDHKGRYCAEAALQVIHNIAKI
ncbi:MAG: 6,7-dimethyl-8-ribityllumazine synthase [Gammaproteobacteria bacterium]|jgi:6,7-dimethyl-8-ribityllumazine synthase|nr:6,7-dimethyl-8-ribityllumazine synthase [Gammaproteobacteria bacterium]